MRRTRNRPLAAGRLGAAEGSVLGASLSLLGLAELAYFTNAHRGGGGRRHAGQLRLPLHAAQDAHVAGHAHRRGAGRAAAGHRLDRRHRRHLGARASCSSASSSCGRCRTSWRSRGCIATTTRARASRCCRCSNPTGAAPGTRRCSTRRCCGRSACCRRVVGLAGLPYSAVATVLGFLFIGLSVRFAQERSHATARRLFLFSILYLALLLGALVANRLWM